MTVKKGTTNTAKAKKTPAPKAPGKAPGQELPMEAKADESAKASAGGSPAAKEAAAPQDTKSEASAGTSAENTEVLGTGETSQTDTTSQADGEKGGEAPAAPKEEKPDPVLSRAKEVFASHTVDEIYFTSDGTAFIQQQYAVIHSENLVDDTVRPVKRQEVI